MPKKRKKSLVGWTYPFWYHQFEYQNDLVSHPFYIQRLKSGPEVDWKKKDSPGVKVRITVEEI